MSKSEKVAIAGALLAARLSKEFIVEGVAHVVRVPKTEDTAHVVVDSLVSLGRSEVIYLAYHREEKFIALDGFVRFTKTDELVSILKWKETLGKTVILVANITHQDMNEVMAACKANSLEVAIVWIDGSDDVEAKFPHVLTSDGTEHPNGQPVWSSIAKDQPIYFTLNDFITKRVTISMQVFAGLNETDETTVAKLYGWIGHLPMYEDQLSLNIKVEEVK